ncbi:MAG: patatin-like phospholipase family protein [Acidimicrobiia bacterium]|nr:patatin-like phospholipase family protein [Acidimicrobiia bacterium]
MKTAFVLGGGGRWGAVEVGMLKALEEAGVRPDLIVGTSIGAFNGSVVAADTGPGAIRRLTDLWNQIAGARLLSSGAAQRLKNLAFMRPAIHSSDELREMLESVHGRDATIEDLEIPFQCVASSIENAAEHWFTEGPLVEALLASSAIPVLLAPVEIGGEHFYDGGIVNSIPIDRAIELGATTVFALQVGRVEVPLRPPGRLHEAALLSFEIARRHRFRRAMRDFADDVELHLLPSGNPLGFDDRRQLRWRDTTGTSELINSAYLASSAYLKEALRQ